MKTPDARRLIHEIICSPGVTRMGSRPTSINHFDKNHDIVEKRMLINPDGFGIKRDYIENVRNVLYRKVK